MKSKRKIDFTLFFSDMECPELEISDVELESRMEGRKIGAQVNFTCPRGFDLKGGNQIVCQKNGKSKCSIKNLKNMAISIDNPHNYK